MAPAVKHGTVHVEAHRGARRFDRRIFGQFIEHFHRQIHGGIFEPGSPLSDRRGFRTDVMEAVRALRVPIVRWPGGCFASSYHWADGVGGQRKPVYDKAWLVEDPNTFGTDEFVDWCRDIGAEPYICTNAGTGDAEEMADWVEYCNGTAGAGARSRAANGHMQPHNVRFWSVGNENYGDWEMGAKTIPQWGPFVAESAKMMLRVDPSLKLSAAAVAKIEWTLPLLKEAGRYLTWVSIHKYWDPLWQKNEPADYGTCMLASTDPQEEIALTESIIKVAGLEGRVKIAFDEWNLRGWHHPPAHGVHAADVAARDKNDINATYTMADAVFSACFLNACIRRADSVEMACMAPLVNTRGPLFTHATGIVKRTSYHTLWMFANLLENNVASAWVESDAFEHGQGAVPALDAVATCDDERRTWRLLLVNRDAARELSCRLHLEGAALDGPLEATVLAGDSPDAFNDTAHPKRVEPIRTRLETSGRSVRLPPHSISVVSVPGPAVSAGALRRPSA
jgi:alpha-L-arabinofuranosidase